jgi:hypothetical protein
MPRRTVTLAALAAIAALTLTTPALAQTRPGCGWGPQSLSRSLEPTDGAKTRSMTVCPGRAATICVDADKGFALRVVIEGQGQENVDVSHFCATVSASGKCREVPIDVLSENSYTTGFQMSCH